MKLDRIVARALGPFVELDVDLDALPGPLVAVTGRNGEGKTMFLELLVGGAFYRTLPTYGSLPGLARDRHACVEVTSGAWVVKHLVDGVSGRAEASVLVDGVPVLESTKVRAFDAWVRSHLPSPDVVYASTFGVQGAGGFLRMRPAERKAVLLRALGLDRLEALAQAARERARAVSTDADVVAARLSELRIDEEAGGRAFDAELAVRRIEQELADARAVVEAAAERALAVEVALVEARADERARREIVRRVQNAEEALDAACGAREAVERVLERESELRTMEARRAALRAELDAVRERGSESRARHATAAEGAEAARARVDTTRRAIALARQQVTRLEERGASLEEVRTRAAGLEAARAGLEAARNRRDRVRTKIDGLAALAMQGTDRRIGALRGGLDRVASGHSDPREVAACTLAHDDERALELRGLPARDERARADLSEAERALAQAERAVRDAELAAQRLDELGRIGADLEAARVAVAVAEAEAAAAAAESAAADEFRDARARALERCRAEHRRVQGELAAVSAEGLLDRDLEMLATARARAVDLADRVARAAASLEAARAELAGCPEPATIDEAPIRELDAARERVRALELDAARARQAHGAASAAAAAAAAAETRHAELVAAREQVDRELVVWRRLAVDLGRDGLQALEIDAAGPELSSTINALLHECYGPRWTVTIETTRPDASGHREIEDLVVRVLDVVAGRDAPAEAFSGGQCVILSEAVSLALAIIACRRSGMEEVTLVRDESAAALDPEHTRAWIAMLRRAVEIVGARRVLIVSHNAEVPALCDAELRVEAGRVERVR